MAKIADDALVTEVSREVLRRADPDELASFTAQCRNYFAHPEKALLGGRKLGEELGYGTGEVVAVLAPFVLVVVNDMLTEMAKDLMVDRAKKGAEQVRRTLRRRFHLEPARDEDVALSAEEIAAVRRHVVAKARAVGLPEDRAELLGDAVVGALTRPR